MPVHTTDWVGQTLDRRYRVSALLGEGGMGYVLRAHDSRLGCDVVLKVPRPEMLADAEFRTRFRDEVVALVRLAHPHIVKVTDYCQHEGTPFAVMQFLAGGSLDDRRPRNEATQPKPVSPRTLGEWLRPIADALDFIHREGYVHRDVKPANILFDAHKHSFLSDFGVAKALAGGQADRKGLTGVGMVIGTPEYMAPELVMGEPADGRIDQYALAITVYEILSGRVPFTGATGPAVLVKQTSEAARPLSEIRPTVSPALSDAVARGMAKKSGDRFPNCVAFADAVLAGVDRPAAKSARPTPASTPVQSAPDTPRATATAPIVASFKTPPAARRSRKVLFAIAGGALALLAVTAIGIWLVNRPTPAPSAPPDTSPQVTANDPKPPEANPDIVRPAGDVPKINPVPAPPASGITDVLISPPALKLIAAGPKQDLVVHVVRNGTGPVTVEVRADPTITVTPADVQLAGNESEARFSIGAMRSAITNTGEAIVTIRGGGAPRAQRVPLQVQRIDFRIGLVKPAVVDLQPGDSHTLELRVERAGGYHGPIFVEAVPSDVFADGLSAKIESGQSSGQIVLRARENAPIGETRARIRAKAEKLSIDVPFEVPVRIYRPPALVATIGKSATPITAAAIHGDFDGVLKILTGGADGSVHNWYRPDPKRHPNDFKWGWSHAAHKKAVSALAFSSDGRQAVSGSADGTVALWDTHTRNEITRKLNGNGEWHKTGVWHVYFQPRGALPEQFGFSAMLDNPAPVSISDDAGILWDVSSPGGGGGPKMFPVGGRQRPARFAPRTGQSTLRGPYTRLVQSNAASFALAGLTRQTLEISRNGSVIDRLTQHGANIQSMCLGADGNRALTLDTEGQLRLWDVKAKSLHVGFPWKPDGEDIGAAALSADGSYILIGDAGGTLTLWRVP